MGLNMWKPLVLVCVTKTPKRPVSEEKDDRIHFYQPKQRAKIRGSVTDDQQEHVTGLILKYSAAHFVSQIRCFIKTLSDFTRAARPAIVDQSLHFTSYFYIQTTK